MSGRARIGQEMTDKLCGVNELGRVVWIIAGRVYGNEKYERYRSPKAIAETTQKR